MPNFDYECPACETVVEKNVPIQDREDQQCDTCTGRLTRKYSFNGSVWSPTKNGGMS